MFRKHSEVLHPWRDGQDPEQEVLVNTLEVERGNWNWAESPKYSEFTTTKNNSEKRL